MGQAKKTGNKELCMQLLHAEGEAEVIELLKAAGYWDNPDLWRLYGDKEGNFALAGNQQALAEAGVGWAASRHLRTRRGMQKGRLKQELDVLFETGSEISRRFG